MGQLKMPKTVERRLYKNYLQKAVETHIAKLASETLKNNVAVIASIQKSFQSIIPKLPSV